MIELIVVGAGDAVKNRHAQGIRVMRGEHLLEVRFIIDVRPAGELRAEIQAIDGLRAAEVHQLKDASPQGLLSLVRRLDLSSKPVVLATPTAFHVPYACVLLRGGFFVAVEKPVAHRLEDLAAMDMAIKELGTDRLFLFGYYALERGLGLRILGAYGRVDEAYLHALEPEFSALEWHELRRTLGRLRRIRGAILEGVGTAATIDHRPWVLAPESGGNTVETFYHLVCMARCLIPSDNMVIAEVALMRDKGANNVYQGRFGVDGAETFTAACLRYGDVEASLVAAKYVPESLNQRWMMGEFEHGDVLADFEASTLTIRSPTATLGVGLRYPARYVTQYRLLVEKVYRPPFPTEYDLFRQALVETLAIREAGLHNQAGRIQDVIGADIDDYLVGRWLGNHY